MTVAGSASSQKYSWNYHSFQGPPDRTVTSIKVSHPIHAPKRFTNQGHENKRRTTALPRADLPSARQRKIIALHSKYKGRMKKEETEFEESHPEPERGLTLNESQSPYKAAVWRKLTPGERLRRSWAMRSRLADPRTIHDRKLFPKP
jgi:hypothetical protein